MAAILQIENNLIQLLLYAINETISAIIEIPIFTGLT